MSENVISHLFEYLQKIHDSGQKTTTVYVAIGSAAHMKKNQVRVNDVTGIAEDCWSIEPKFEQQFPVFLSSLKSVCPSAPVHIILIDPCIESPPFVTCNQSGEVAECWRPMDFYGDTIYEDDVTNVTVYPIKCSVTYPNDIFAHPENKVQSVDITAFFENLNAMAIDNDWFVVVQDYSGRNICVVGEHFSSQLAKHHDHIIYGIAAGMDGGCYIDLTSPACNFVYQISDDRITVVNPKCFEENFCEFFDAITFLSGSDSKSKDRDLVIMKEQAKIFIDEKINTIRNEIMPILRQSAMSLRRDDVTFYVTKSRIAESKYGLNFQKMIKEKKFEEMVAITKDVLRRELVEIVFLFHREHAEKIVDDVLMQMFSQDDPYKWHDHVSRLLNKTMDESGLFPINFVKKSVKDD
jgi:hypothetical protein